MRIENNDFDIRWFDTLESTNEYCKLLDPKTVEEFTVISARSQTSGIGQRGNTWNSEAGKNLTFSLILKPNFLAADEQYSLTMALSLAVAETLEELFSVLHSPFPVYIKWPNDIYVGDRKICGILATNQLVSNQITQSICGIGLNINQIAFPDWIPNPTSLQLLTGREFNLNDVLHNLLAKISHRYWQLRNPHNYNSIKESYLDRLYRLGIPSCYVHNGRTLRATITGIDRFGHLQLQTDDGQSLSCAMKDIQFII